MDARSLNVPWRAHKRDSPESRRWQLDRIGSSLGSFSVRLRDVWSSQGPANRMIVGALGALIVLRIVYFAFMRLRPVEYATLLSNLSPDEAHTVVNKLD